MRTYMRTNKDLIIYRTTPFKSQALKKTEELSERARGAKKLRQRFGNLCEAFRSIGRVKVLLDLWIPTDGGVVAVAL